MPLLLLVRRFGCIARGKSLVTWRVRGKLREPTLFLAQTPYPMPPAHKVSLRILLRPPPQRRSPKPTHLVRSIRPERRLPPELTVLPLCPAQLAVPRLGPPAAAPRPPPAGRGVSPRRPKFYGYDTAQPCRKHSCASDRHTACFRRHCSACPKPWQHPGSCSRHTDPWHRNSYIGR